jgi:hypothetical protein
MCNSRPFVWDTSNTSVTAGSPKVGGFVQGFEAQYLNDPAMRAKIQSDSTAFGVNADTTAIP